MKKILISFSLFSQFVFAQTIEIPKNENQFIDKTILEQFYNENDFEALISEYKKTPFLSPDYINHQLQIIFYYNSLDRKKEALDLCESLINNKLLSPNYEIPLAYGSLLSDDEKYDKAIEQFDIAKKFLTNSPVLNYNYALVYYRQGKVQEAINMLKHNLIYYPYHDNSIFMLGKIALEDSNLAVATSVFMTYLLTDPTGSQSKYIINVLDKKLSSYNTGTSKYKYSENGDDLSELDMILKNDFALNPKYKIRLDLDENFTRNLQIVYDYYKDHNFKDGFVENNFGKWISDVANKNFVKEFTYYSLISLLDTNPKILGKNKKNLENFIKTQSFIDAFTVYATKNINNKKTQINLHEEQYKYTIFSSDVVDLNNFDGKLIYPNGNIKREYSYKDGLEHGIIREYSSDGILTFEASIKSENNFDFKTFSPITKAISSSGTMVNDKLEKTKIIYDIFGNKKIAENYENGKYNNFSHLYYPDGSVKVNREYKDGEYNGTYEYFSESGKQLHKGNYLKNMPNGDVVFRFPNGDTKSIERGNNGFYEYFESKNVLGNIVEKNFYEKGKLSKSESYNDFGKVSIISEFDKNGELSLSKYFDWEGNLYFEDQYKNSELTNSIHYSRKNLKGTKIQRKGNYEYKDFEDRLIYTVPYVNGKQNGIKKAYNTNGILISENYYVDDLLHGESKQYFSSGSLYLVSNYENGKKNGLQFKYDGTGNLIKKSHFVDGELNGMETEYYDGKKIKNNIYYQNDERNGKAIYFNLNGEVERISYFKNDLLYKQENYINGILIDIDDRLSKSGKYTVKRSNVEVFNTSTINGQRHGEFTVSLTDGTSIEQYNYINTELHGIQKKYNLVGKLVSISNYDSGALQGDYLEYDDSGLLNTKTIYKNNTQIGVITKYYPNGKIFSTTESFDDYNHGEQIFYNYEGQPVMAIGYEQDIIKYYKVLENEKLSSPIEYKKATKQQIISNYNNKKPALVLTINKGLLDENFDLYEKNGNTSYKVTYNKYIINSLDIYYPNGKTYFKSQYLNGNLTNSRVYFDSQGNKIVEQKFENGYLHGDTKYYNNALPIKTVTYDSGVITNISK